MVAPAWPLVPPPELIRRSKTLTALGIVYAIALYLIPTFLLQTLWSGSAPWWIKIPLSLMLALVGAYGVTLSAFMGHDGTHFTLHSNRVVSSVIGLVVTSPIFPYFLMGFTISHWNHHRFTNTEKDPDALVFSRFHNFFSRALLARPFAFYIYARKAIRLALGRPVPDQGAFPLPAKTIRHLAQLNVALNFTSFVIQLWLSVNLPSAYLPFLFILGCSSIVSGLNPYIEHNGTSLGRGQDTRTSSGAWWDFALLGNNYHLEHHLYPTVPFYRLKGVHQYLKDRGHYAGSANLTEGAIAAYRKTTSRYEYPQFIAKNATRSA